MKKFIISMLFLISTISFAADLKCTASSNDVNGSINIEITKSDPVMNVPRIAQKFNGNIVSVINEIGYVGHVPSTITIIINNSATSYMKKVNDDVINYTFSADNIKVVCKN